MPRLDSDEGSEDSVTLRSSPSRVLAKSPNTTGDLDESGDAPQGQLERGSSASMQKRHVPTASATATHADGSDQGVPIPENLESQVANLTKHLEAVSSQAASQVLQTFWRKFLFPDNGDDHLCWVLRAGLKNAPPNVIERVLKDPTIVKILAPVVSQKQAVAAAVLEDLPYDQLLLYIPELALDQIIRQRLKTMPAKPLIRCLAEAERLGFREDDVLDEDDESVMPNLSTAGLIPPAPAIPSPYAAAPANAATGYTHINDGSRSGSDVEMMERPPAHYNPSPHNSDHQLAVHGHNAAAARQPQYPVVAPPPQRSSHSNPLGCPDCHLVLPTASGYNYHIWKKFCHHPPRLGGYKWSCQNCGRGFTTKQGMNHHVNLAKVCFDNDIAPATSPSSRPSPQPQSQSQPPQVQRPHPTAYSAPYAGIQTGAVLPPPILSSSAAQRPPAWHSPAQPPPASAPQYSEHAHPTPPPPTTAKIPTPPLQTPVPNGNRSGATNRKLSWVGQETPQSENRMSPSELSPSKFAQLNKALADQEAKYQRQCAAVDPTLEPREREAKLQSLKNVHATKKSHIRKSFGVSLRIRDKANPDSRSRSSRPSMQGYRANPAVSGAVTDSTPARPSPLSAPSSSFSPVNAATDNAPAQGEMPSYNEANAHKRQRTNYSLPGQAPEQSPAVGTGHGPLAQIPGSTQVSRDETVKEPAGPSNTAPSSIESSARASPTNATQYIDIVTTSEDSGSDDTEGIPQYIPPSTSRPTTSNGYHAAGGGAGSPSSENKGSTGPVRGTFTAKRVGGVHR